VITPEERLALHLTDEAFTARQRAEMADDRPTALYRFFDAEGGLLYIGITASVPSRISEHSRKAWCWQAASVTLDWYPSASLARAAERIAIQTEQPRHNIAGRLRQVS
jgi:predicted GIY-YIG superfamily endonuclease